MSGELEAAGTAIEGALLGAAIDNAGNAGSGAAGGACLNCGAQLSGPYCVQCGQHAHVHRTLAAIWHDILHSVLHFDGKFWRTLPLLALRPGELTRRYIAGERAKFVSPMALFLFSIFLMFAVFSFIGSPFSGPNGPDLQRDIAQQATQLDKDIAVTQNQIADPEVPAAAKIGLKAKLNDLKGERNGIALIQTGKVKYRDADSLVRDGNISVSALNGPVTGIKWLDDGVRNAAEKTVANPSLALYKLQSNGYKFAWLLIPLSLPFLWLATLGVRGHRFYDHAVFATYSISFMSLLFLTVAILAKIGLSEGWLVLAFFVIPPLHLYKQLRHAYGFGRPSAVLRLMILSLFIWIVLALFASILLFLGILG